MQHSSKKIIFFHWELPQLLQVLHHKTSLFILQSLISVLRESFAQEICIFYNCIVCIVALVSILLSWNISLSVLMDPSSNSGLITMSHFLIFSLVYHISFIRYCHSVLELTLRSFVTNIKISANSELTFHSLEHFHNWLLYIET